MENDETGAATARILAFLSQQQQRRQRQLGGRLFECKTCGRQFPTFQALGGHRASHRRPGPYPYGLGSRKLEAAAHDGECAAGPWVHGCPICGLEFPVGQALGGHMRRHRPAATNARAQVGSRTVTPEACSSGSTSSAMADNNGGDCAGGICLELNLMPWASCTKCQKNAALGAKPQGVEEMSILDCIL